MILNSEHDINSEDFHATDGEVIIDIPASSSEAVIIGVDDNNTNNAYYSGGGLWKASIFYLAGSLYYTEMSSAQTPVATAFTSGASSQVKIKRAGSTTTAEWSTDSGATWNIFHTFGISLTTLFYIKADFALGSPYNKLINARLN